MLKICLVGHKGYWAKFLARTLNNTENVKITSLVDATEKSQCYERDQPCYARTIDDALDLAHKDIDAVVIATPPETHYAVAKTAIEAGKHVLIEKPMTTCTKHAIELNLLAEENGVKIGVDHTFLFSDHIRVIKAMLLEGKIGRPLRIVSNRENLGKFQDSGVVWDLMPHDVAMTNYLMGGRPKVEDAKFFQHLHPAVTDTAQINMCYLSPVTYEPITYTLNLSWLYPKKIRNTVIIGLNGMIEYDMLSDKPLRLYDKKAIKGDQSWLHSFNWISEYQGDSREPLQALIEEFRDYCLDNKPFPSKGDLGQEVVECIEDTLAFTPNPQAHTPEIL